MPIDILTFVHKKFDFDKCYNRARVQQTQGHTIRVLHINDLREIKVFAKRNQDFRDVIMIDDFLKEEKSGQKQMNIWAKIQFWKRK
ncbi:hypothetical protein [Emticicia sp. SJ17W-69]|uniref:hypothetical protein n=1 Tax=Emticicia sp. SJ17W-69 TaxID=3421657 RepID=UPI003EB69983